MRIRTGLFGSCVLAVMMLVSTVSATSPYDMPYGIQWNFLIGHNNDDNPTACTMSPDGTIWITTMGAGNSGGSPALTWGNPTGIYAGSYASGYGQISPTGFILQGNDFPGVPGMSNYSQGYSPTVLFAGNDPTAYISLNVNRAAIWTDAAPPDAVSHNTALISFSVTSLKGSTPVDYDGTPSITLPIANVAGLSPAAKFSHELLNTTYYNGSAHDNVMASDGSYYFCTGNQGNDTNNPPDMFTVGDFSGPYGQSYKPAIGWVAADGLTFSGPAHQPSCGGRSFFSDVDLNETAGKVYAAGYGYTSSGGTMDFLDPDGPGPIPQIAFSTSTAGDAKGFAVVYDTATWAVQKTVTWESSYGDDFCTDITATPDGGFVLVGQTLGGLGGKTNPAPGTNDGYMEQYNADGSLAWNYQTETAVSDTFGDVTVDPADASVYVSGNRHNGSNNDPFLMKFTSSGALVWTRTIDNGGTEESQRDHGNIDKHKIYFLSEYNPSAGGTPWVNTISYAPTNTDEVLLQKLSPGDFDDGTATGTTDGLVDFDDVQYAGSRSAPGLTGVDTYDFDGDGNSTLADAYYMISNIMDRTVGDIHPGAMPEPLSDVDNADIGKALGSYTGAGGGGKPYLEGDVDFDGDVDEADVAFVAAKFSGALTRRGKRSPSTEPPSGRAELVYNTLDGSVWIYASRAAGGAITSFQLENTHGTFVPANYKGPSGGNLGGAFEDVTENVIADTDLTFTGFSGFYSLGNVFPAEMSQEELEVYLTTAVYTGRPGSGQWGFNLVVVSGPFLPGTMIYVR